MKVMIHLSPGGGNLLVVRQTESHGGGRMVGLVFDGFRALTDGIFCFCCDVDEIDDQAGGEMSPVRDSPMASPGLESPGVTRSRTLPSSKMLKNISSEEQQQQQQRARVLRKQKRTSVQLPKKSEIFSSP